MNAHPAVQNGVGAANPAAETRLACRIQKRFAGQQNFAVDVAFEAAAGFTILFGASGAGKTTLLDCVAGLTRPDSGRIAIGDRVLFDSSSGVNLPVAERHVGYVFQNLALFPHMTAEQNVSLRLEPSCASNERKQRTAAILQALPHRASQPPECTRHLWRRAPASRAGSNPGHRSAASASG